jgi:trehalose 6-phosphate synthase
MAQRIVVAANRLPVSRVGEEHWELSPGGLVSALTPILQESDGVWIGWSGSVDEKLEPFEFDGIVHIPVALSPEEIDNYYLGFSNGTIWPLFHDAIRTPDYHRHWWRSYREVNARFANEVVSAAASDDLIWIHDYQLLLAPRMVRDLSPDLETRFFLHIPFPPVELYARLPWRTEVIEGMLGADVVGFQTERGAGNFVNAALAFTDAQAMEGGLSFNGHETRVVATPISIETDKFERLAAAPATENMVNQIRDELGNPEVILLGADRLDYTKGINVRLRAFETLLELDPGLADRLKFVQIGVPSRSSISDYADIKREIEQIAGRINSMYGSRHRLPVHYIYESLTPAELVAYYRAADVMVVTPFADGMNLVAKEYVASRIHGGGVLLLSEFAGAAREFRDALLVNPYDIDGMASLMMRAITMDAEEGRRRMESMRTVVKKHDVHLWARLALGSDLDIARR